MLKQKRTKKTNPKDPKKKCPILIGIAIPIFWKLGCWDHHSSPPRGEGLTIHEPTDQGHSHGLWGSDMRAYDDKNPALDVPGSYPLEV